MLSVANKPFMQSAIMLSVVMLSVVILSVVMLSVVATLLDIYGSKRNKGTFYEAQS